jgi:hypothetical protein
MTRFRLCFIALMLMTLMFTCAIAGQVETVSERIDAGDAKSVVVDCEFGAGELYIRGADISEAAVLDVTYSPDKVDYSIKYHVRNGIGELSLESRLIKKRNVDKIDNSWELTLSNTRPVEVHMDIGACQAEIDFGGIPLTELSLDIGAASGLIEFSSPNPERLRRLDIDVGASSVEFNRLGNANFEQMSIDCGAASLEVDLRGDIRGEAIADFDIGMGSADIVVPEGLAIRVESDGGGWFSSVDFESLKLDEVSSGVWESDDFESAKDRLILRIDVGMGSVDIRAR